MTCRRNFVRLRKNRAGRSSRSRRLKGLASRADPPTLVALGHRTRATQLSQCPLLPPRGREAGPLRVGSHPLSCHHHLFPCARLCAPSTFRGASEPTRTLPGEMHADFSCRAGKYPIPGHAAPQAQHVRVVQTQAFHLTMFPRLQRGGIMRWAPST